MSRMRSLVNRSGVATAALAVAAGLAVGGCGSGSNSSASNCSAKSAATSGLATAAGGSSNPAVAPGWTLPGGTLANTRDVASPITSSNVSTLGVAWCVPIESTGGAGAVGVTDGYSTTPVVVNGVVYLQDMESNVMAIRL